MTWWQRMYRGEGYVDFHKEPLVKVADRENEKYRGLLIEMGRSEHVNDISYLTKLAIQRKTVCEARLQAARSSTNKFLRDESLSLEAELWYTDIAVDTLNGKHKDKRVLQAVTRSIAGEIIQLDRELYLKREAKMSQGPVGEVIFEKRVKEFVGLADTFSTALSV